MESRCERLRGAATAGLVAAPVERGRGVPMIDLSGRHPATQQIARWFAFEHLPTAGLREVSARCEHVAMLMIRDLPDGSELTTGLRKLLEAKDCFVRAALPPEE